MLATTKILTFLLVQVGDCCGSAKHWWASCNDVGEVWGLAMPLEGCVQRRAGEEVRRSEPVSYTHLTLPTKA